MTGNDRAVSPGVLLDLDGTLVDSNYLQTLAWARAFDDLGEWAPMNAIHRLIGAGGSQLVTRLLGHENPRLEERRAVRYREVIGEVRPFPGAKSFVVELRDAGLSVVLATSSPADEVDIVVDLLDIGDAFTAITTAHDVAEAKPAPDVFVTALSAGAVDPCQAVVIGDSVWDVRAAIDAGLGSIGVESGGFSRHRARGGGRAGGVSRR